MNLIEKVKTLFTGSSPAAHRTRQWVKIIFLFALFGGLFWVVPIEKVFKALLSADLRFFFVGWIVAFFSTALNALELLPMIRKQDLRHKLGEILMINLAVKFYSLFMPGSIVGSGLRWYRISQPGGKKAEALAALGFFRILETFLSISFGLTFLVLSNRNTGLINRGWLLVLALAIILIWFVITRWSYTIYNWFKARLAWLWKRSFLSWFFRGVEKILLAVVAYADMPVKGLIISVLAGVTSLFAGVISNWLVAQAVGIDLSIVIIGWIYAVVILATQLPFAIAGGLGIREATLVAIMPSLGISAELALAFSFMLFIRGALTGLVGGIIEAYNIIYKKRHSEIKPKTTVKEI